MILHCPSCHAEMPLDIALTHEDYRRQIVEVLRISLPLGAQIDRYLRLFKPAKQRIRMDKVVKLLADLVPDIQRQAIDRNGREWCVPIETWKLGFEAVFEAHAKGTLELPLDGHAYLYTVLMRMVDKHEAQAERDSEESRRAGRAHVGGPAALGAVIEDMDRAINGVRTAAATLATVPQTPAARPSFAARQMQARLRRATSPDADSSTTGDSE